MCCLGEHVYGLHFGDGVLFGEKCDVAGLSSGVAADVDDVRRV